MLGGATATLNDRRATAPEARGAPVSVDIGDVIRALLSRIYWLAPCLALTLAAAIGYYEIAPKVYVANLSMFVDPRDPASLGLDGAQTPHNPDAALVESQMRLLTSGEVLRRVAEAELGAPHAQGPLGEGSQRSTAGSPLAADNPLAMQVMSLAARLVSSVTAKHSDKDYIIDIEVRAPSRDQAVNRANALVTAYFDIDAQVNTSVASRQGAWLDQRIADLRARTQAAESRVAAYKTDQALVVNAAGELPTEQQLKDANAALVAAGTKRADAAARLEQIRSAMNADPASDAVPDAVRSPTMLSLKVAYASLVRQEASLRPIVGPLHPDYIALRAQLAAVKTQIQSEMQRIAATTEHELSAAVSSERSAAQQVKSLGAAANRDGPQRDRLNELEREATAVRTTYEKALAALENVQRDVVHASLGTVVDPVSAPFAPISPKLSPALMIAGAAGVNLWIVMALLAEYRLRAPAYSKPVAGGKTLSMIWRPFAKTTRPPQRFRSVDLSIDAPFFLRAADGFKDSRVELRAIRRSVRAGGEYAARMQEILDCALATAGKATEGLDRPPFIAVVGGGPNVGASTLILSLAEQAATGGAQVLIDDRQPNRSSAITYAQTTDIAFLSPNGRRILVLRPRGANGGAIFVTGPTLGGRQIPIDVQTENVDLVLIDAGNLSQFPQNPPDKSVADALIFVGRDSSDPKALDREIDQSKSLGSCACVVLSPEFPGGDW